MRGSRNNTQMGNEETRVLQELEEKILSYANNELGGEICESTELSKVCDFINKLKRKYA